LLCPLAASIASGQDFSGAWKLKSVRVEKGTLPERAAVLEIEHRGAAIRCVPAAAGCPPAASRFAIDGRDYKWKEGGTSFTAVAKWEGSVLLINTIVNGSSSAYTQMDRWTVLRDRSTLTIGREIVSRSGGAEATLVYERERPPARSLSAQQASNPPASPAPPAAPKPAEYTLEPGTRIPVTLINSVSTKQSVEGDRVYLATAFPIVSQGRVVIPPGSYVAGTLTFVKRPGRVVGRGEIFLRFDSLLLPNGVSRDFHSHVGALDGQTGGDLDRREGNIKGEGGKGTDVRTIGEAAATGASVGAIAGAAAGRPGLGVGAGAAAGAAAGLMTVLLSRGPDLLLARGATLEMVLDRKLVFTADELVGQRR
jgi:type IV secretion system protein VirB10